MKKFPCLVLVFFTLFACKSVKKETNILKEQLSEGRLVDLTGLDGCSWVIELTQKTKDGYQRLEPFNLNAFDIKPVNGLSVYFSWEPYSGSSVCMAGKPVSLTRIKVK